MTSYLLQKDDKTHQRENLLLEEKFFPILENWLSQEGKNENGRIASPKSVQWTVFTTTAFVPKYFGVKLNLLLKWVHILDNEAIWYKAKWHDAS